MNPPQGKIIDHIDGDGLNNQKSNLRICDHAQNIHNSRISDANTTGYKGVYKPKHTSKWRAHIGYNKNLVYLGYFDTKEEAAKAYDEAAKGLFGHFARTNF